MDIGDDAMGIGSWDLRRGVEVVVRNRDVFARMVGLLKK